MSQSNPEALAFLLSRRSRPYKILGLPAPTRDELMPILTAAARTPDHGKLEPWRFVVVQGDAMARLADLVSTRGTALGKSDDDIAKARAPYEMTPMAVAVIETQKPSDKIPAIEMTYSAGAACLGLLNAALAAGWGANWLSGWASHDAEFGRAGLGLAGNERIAGLIHIGTANATPPERPRPDIDTITSWMSQ
ncbi:MAG: nitroreductase family protein [Marinibacterium sp.]|nr:nitroreductase family protein [Marinibacterium sp.]